MGETGTLSFLGTTLTMREKAGGCVWCGIVGELTAWPAKGTPGDDHPANFATDGSCACPRDFNFCGSHGEWVVVGNQDEDNVLVLARDADTGAITPLKTPVWVECAAPVCVLPLW